MKASVLAIVLGSSIIAACLVDRPSTSFECSTQADCTDGRSCTGGYCVVSECPSDCTSCDEAAMTCQVQCTGADDCNGTIDCPSGWTCTINCVGDGACNDIQCASGLKCVITCTGDNACEDVDCSDACACDLACIGAACGSMSCPAVGAGSVHDRRDDRHALRFEPHAAGCAKC